MPEKKDKLVLKALPIKDYHKQPGHHNMVVTKSTAVARGVNLTGTAEMCKDGAVGKAQQKNVPKATVKRATVPGERMFIDILSPAVSGVGRDGPWWWRKRHTQPIFESSHRYDIPTYQDGPVEA